MQISTTQLRILVADDNIDAGQSLAIILEMRNHVVDTAVDGLEAVQKAVTFEPDVCILDIGMPDLNGFDVCKAIRKLPKSDRTTIVALTGWNSEKDRLRSKEAGFDWHFPKPIDPVDLGKIEDLHQIRLKIGADQ